MKITSAINSIGSPPETSRAKAATNTQRPAAAPGEQVELSPLSARLQEVEANIASSPVVDAARVAEIKQAISQGRFQINPERIADGLLESVRQMLAKR